MDIAIMLAGMLVFVVLSKGLGSPPDTDDWEEYKEEAPGRFLNCLVITLAFAVFGWLVITLSAAGVLLDK